MIWTRGLLRDRVLSPVPFPSSATPASISSFIFMCSIKFPFHSWLKIYLCLIYWKTLFWYITFAGHCRFFSVELLYSPQSTQRYLYTYRLLSYLWKAYWNVQNVTKSLSIAGYRGDLFQVLDWGRKDICDVQNAINFLCLMYRIQEFKRENKWAAELCG